VVRDRAVRALPGPDHGREGDQLTSGYVPLGGVIASQRVAEPFWALAPLGDHPAVADVRAGVGLLGAVELADPSKLQAVIDAAHARGVLVRGIRGVALQVSPPFVITEDEIATTARVFCEALDEAA
jgi:adenosylmethionine-8-amino-7-oxononanoate aminotransferase